VWHLQRYSQRDFNLMTLEVIKCPECGSNDVFEFKPGTYLCKSSETVFKHIDPTTMRIEHRPDFCTCGLPIEVQCQLCPNTMCSYCDAIGGVILALRTREWPVRKVGIPTVGFGYLLGQRSGLWTVAGGRPIEIGSPRHRPGETVGPLLMLDELVAALPHPSGGLRHVCWNCVAAQIPRVANQIAERFACEDPGCSAAPEATCPCCHASVCNLHFARPRGFSITAATYRTAERSFPVTFSWDTCPTCSDEQDSSARSIRMGYKMESDGLVRADSKLIKSTKIRAREKEDKRHFGIERDTGTTTGSASA
jgi:hypothetical protein